MRYIMGAVLVAVMTLLCPFNQVSLQDDKKAQDQEEENRIKDLKYLRELRGKAFSAIQKWSKEADFEKLKKDIEEWANKNNCISEFSAKKVCWEGVLKVEIDDNNEVNSNTDFGFSLPDDKNDSESMVELERYPYTNIRWRETEKIDFSGRNLSLPDVIDEITKGINFILPQDKGMENKKVSCCLKNIEQIEALRLILETNGYVLEVNGGQSKYDNSWYQVLRGNKFIIPSDLLDTYRRLASKDILTNDGNRDDFISKAACFRIIIDNKDKLGELYLERIKSAHKDFVKRIYIIKP